MIKSQSPQKSALHFEVPNAVVLGAKLDLKNAKQPQSHFFNLFFKVRTPKYLNEIWGEGVIHSKL